MVLSQVLETLKNIRKLRNNSKKVNYQEYLRWEICFFSFFVDVVSQCCEWWEPIDLNWTRREAKMSEPQQTSGGVKNWKPMFPLYPLKWRSARGKLRVFSAIVAHRGVSVRLGGLWSGKYIKDSAAAHLRIILRGSFNHNKLTEGKRTRLLLPRGER